LTLGEGMSGESGEASWTPLVSCADVCDDAAGDGGVSRAGNAWPDVLLGVSEDSGGEVS
jgi:hypothetical protein